MTNAEYSPSQSHAFVVRIWWESGSLRPDGRLLWRGRVQHAASGEYAFFRSLSELAHFIQKQTGNLEQVDGEVQREVPT